LRRQLRGYNTIGYTVDDRPDTEASGPDDTQVARDEEALGSTQKGWI
jgi:hypothetical protein